jgi:ABC-type lipoprotein release transport system permease subunit
MLAWRNIWRNKMRSLVIMFSITLGLFAGIAILALYKGMMQSRIRTVIDEEKGHIQLHHPQFTEDYEPIYAITNAKDVVQGIRQTDYVKNICVRSVAQGMLSTPTGTSGVQINGIVADSEYVFSGLQHKLIDSSGFTAGRQNQILIGKKLADKMKLKKGSKIVLTFTDSANNIVAAAFRIAAMYQSTNTPLDERNVYIQQEEMNALMGMPGAVYEIAIKLHRDQDMDATVLAMRNSYPRLKVESWKDLSPETDFMAKTMDDYSYIIMTIIMIALAFGIINTMLMAIMERTREIGMMAALGTSRLRMFMMVVLETVYLTLLGAPIGISMGWLLSTYYGKKGLDLSGMGEEMMRSFGFSTLVYPSFPSEKIISIILIVAATALLASIFPAIKALRMKPIDALRT